MSIDSQARIVIVGGGIMGVALAYHLAEEGETSVMLIEKGELTSGSTWHAAGQCPSLVGNYNLAKIHDYGNRLYPTLEEKTGQYVSWHASGGIRIARQQADLDWFHSMKGIADNVGFRMEIIDPVKIKELNPFYDIDGVIAGAWTMDDGHADPSGLTNAMARGATDMGVKIVRHNRVMDICRAGFLLVIGGYAVSLVEGLIGLVCQATIQLVARRRGEGQVMPSILNVALCVCSALVLPPKLSMALVPTYSAARPDYQSPPKLAFREVGERATHAAQKLEQKRLPAAQGAHAVGWTA